MIVVALGANLPGRYETPEKALQAARREMQNCGIHIVRASRIFKTAPVPVSDQPWYSNAVVAVQTELPPRDLLAALQSIENAMGRVRSEKNAPRIIDLDIIAYNDLVLDDHDLVIPHPRMESRAFVLRPLNDIAPNWKHPRTGKPLAELLSALPAGQIAKPQWFTDRPLYVMGILNVTPDSFSDGGKHLADPVAHAKTMLAEGAHIIDVGGESTRPGAVPLPVADECTRVLPVITALKDHFISIDSRNAATMKAALHAGASMVNDISALSHDPESLAVMAASDAPVCLMHMQGTPQTMQKNPVYKDVVSEVYSWLAARIDACVNAGIDRGRIVVDPGFGFGKTTEHNRELLDNFQSFTGLGVPVLAGVSRKRFLGPDVEPDQRIDASIRAALKTAGKGARIIRVHDVAPTIEALKNPDSVRTSGAA